MLSRRNESKETPRKGTKTNGNVRMAKEYLSRFVVVEKFRDEWVLFRPLLHVPLATATHELLEV